MFCKRIRRGSYIIINMLNNLKKNKPLTALAGFSLLCVLFLTYYVYSPSQNPQLKPDTKIQTSNPQIEKTVYSNIYQQIVSFPTFPSSLPLATAHLTIIKNEDLVNNVSKFYNLLPHESAKDVWLSKDGSVSLSYSDYDGSFSFLIDSVQNPLLYSGTNTPTTKEAFASAEKFVEEVLKLDSRFTSEKNSIEYLLFDKNHLETGSEKKYNLIKINFSQQYQSLPIFIQDSVTYPLSITIGQQNKVVKFEINTKILTDLQNGKIVNIIPPQQAIDNLMAGNGQIISVSGGTGIPSISELKNATISDIKLTYRFNKDTGLLTPTYLATGDWNPDPKYTYEYGVYFSTSAFSKP